MHELLSRLPGTSAGGDSDCGCRPEANGDRLVVDASDCPAGGQVERSSDCRATVVDALAERDVETVVTRTEGTVRAYEDEAAGLLVAAGRFLEAAAFHDERLAERARTDPLAAAREATGRAGPVARIAAETGLAACAARAESYDHALRPFVGPRVSRSRVAARPPPDARLVSTRDLETGATVRVYERPDDAVRTYHLAPLELDFDEAAAATLTAARDRIAAGSVAGGERAPGRAVRTVASERRGKSESGNGSESGGDQAVEDLVAVLRKHTRGYGVLEDLFADDRVSDVFATAPVETRALRVRVDGEAMRTNVRLTEDAAAALASRFRRESGRAFSGADPTLDAAVETENRGVRVAGVTDPVSDGVAFAFRARDADAWTLPALVRNDTLPADAAALCSVAVERGVAGLAAGQRGAGKTTFLGALLWALPPGTRSVVIEDTPELPVTTLADCGRDVQALRSSLDGTGPSPTEALRTALRLGSGALAVGEIRGEEAGVLYEAMRVGSNDGAVLGTIHGDGGAAVRERVVTDLGVPESSFGATDLLVTLESADTPDGTERRVRRIEEVRTGGDGRDVTFAALYDRDDDGLASTDRIERGNSHLVDSLCRPGERYADLRERLADREAWLAGLADAGHTDPRRVERARARRLTDERDAAATNHDGGVS